MASSQSDADAAAQQGLRVLLAAVVGTTLLFLSDLLVPPASAPFPGHGVRFHNMAEAPFAFAGEFPQRILWPLLAWLFGKVGITTLQFSSICNGALIATVFWFAHRRTQSILSALLVATAVAASGAVLVYKPMMCFSDPLNLLLMVLLLHFADRAKVFWSLVVVTAFSHELVFFFSPWLVYLRLCNGGRLWQEVARWAVCLAIYGGFRIILKMTGNSGSYDAQYYFDKAFWVPWGLPAIWMLWGFVVLVEFGPLLVAMFFAGKKGALVRPSGMGGRWWPLLYWSSLLSLMLLAYDVMRFAPLALPPVLLGLLALIERRGGRVLVLVLIGVQSVCYALLHPVASEQGGRHFTEMTGHVLANIGLLASRQPGDAYTFVTTLLGLFWSYALLAAVALFASVLLGRWLARGCKDGADLRPQS